MSPVDTWGKGISSGNSKCKDLEAGACLVHSPDSKVSSRARAEQVRSKMIKDELGRGRDHVGLLCPVRDFGFYSNKNRKPGGDFEQNCDMVSC